MSRMLTAGVIVRHPGSGGRVFLPTGSVLPNWAAGLVGDHVLSEDSDDWDTWQKQELNPEQGEAEVKPPRRSGPGSSAKAWRAYAEQHGVDVAEDADREQVIDALDEAGVPT